MSTAAFLWRGRPVGFRPGESVAAALAGIGVHGYGPDGAGGETRYFCGIGACQGCLVRIDGIVVEACLAPAAEGLAVSALEDGDV